MKPAGPSFRTLNGVGYRPFGWWTDPAISDAYFMLGCFCLLFAPVLPVAVYVVLHNKPKESGYKILGGLSVFRFVKIYGFRPFLLMWGKGFIEGAALLFILFAVLIGVYGLFHWLRHG